MSECRHYPSSHHSIYICTRICLARRAAGLVRRGPPSGSLRELVAITMFAQGIAALPSSRMERWFGLSLSVACHCRRSDCAARLNGAGNFWPVPRFVRFGESYCIGKGLGVAADPCTRDRDWLHQSRAEFRSNAAVRVSRIAGAHEPLPNGPVDFFYRIESMLHRKISNSLITGRSFVK